MKHDQISIVNPYFYTYSFTTKTKHTIQFKDKIISIQNIKVLIIATGELKNIKTKNYV